MDLYRIILVDDEEEVRQSIIRKINWTEAGFQVVGDAAVSYTHLDVYKRQGILQPPS